MADVRLRASARADLAAILDYGTETFGEAVGRAYLKSFEQAFALLGRHSQAGAQWNEIEPPIRCLRHRRHRLFYDIEGDVVWIVRVLHYAMDAETILGT